MWLQTLVDELEAIDREQRPHGLYGLRDVLSRATSTQHLQPLSKVLDGRFPQTHLARRLGWGNCRAWDDSISFYDQPPHGLNVNIETYASTKVRRYGARYLLDKVHGKKVEEGSDFLASAVPKIAKAERNRGRFSPIECLLFIAHVPSPRGLSRLIGKTTEQTFLTLYGLDFASSDWADRYDRKFHTGIFAWACSPGSEQ